MHVVGALSLIFALVLGLVGFTVLITLNTEIAALTTGGLQTLMGLLPAFFMILLGLTVVAAAILVVRSF
jgi:hypothetical protein